MKDLKEKTIRGGFARMCAQAANFLLRVGSLMVLARLLGPKDFGLVGMVTAFTGVLSCSEISDFRLPQFSVRPLRMSRFQHYSGSTSWLADYSGFWPAAFAPAIASFYHEPRLVGVTTVLAAGFLFNAAGVQHSALLQRQMRFTALAVINVGFLACGYRHCHWRGQGRLWILGSRGNDGHSSTHQHYWFVADHSLGARNAAQANRNSFDDAFWRHYHFEWPRCIYRQ